MIQIEIKWDQTVAREILFHVYILMVLKQIGLQWIRISNIDINNIDVSF
jgi:hypothetical protein